MQFLLSLFSSLRVINQQVISTKGIESTIMQSIKVCTNETEFHKPIDVRRVVLLISSSGFYLKIRL